MSNILNSHPIWNYSKKNIPDPFSILSKKRPVCSAYTNETKVGNSVIIPGLVSAFNSYMNAEINPKPMYTKNIALGENDEYYLAEFEDDNGIQIAAYHKESGFIKASLYDPVSMIFSPLSCTHKSMELAKTSLGEVAFLSVMNTFIDDVEVLSLITDFKENFKDGSEIVNQEVLNDTLAILSDNFYRRVTKFTRGDSFIPFDISENGIFPVLTSMNLKGTNYIPTNVFVGTFRVFNTSKQKAFKIKKGEFKIKDDSELSEEEKLRVCVMGDEHTVSEIEYELAHDIKNRWDLKNHRIKNIILEGPAGTGKGEIARALSYHLNMPYATMVCSENTTEDDIKGCILPVIGNEDASPTLSVEEFIEMVQAFPGSLETELDPVSAYEKLTGNRDEDVTILEVFDEINRKTLELAKNVGTSDIKYKFYKSEIVKALENGWILEIQEPTCIRNPSVLSCLNDIMNSESGMINTLLGPIYRHPDSIVIYTTNRYLTNVPLDPAVRDRCITIKTELPLPEEMVRRCQAKTLLKDEKVLAKMVAVITVLSDTVKANGFQGECGMRSLFSWCDDVALGKTLEESIKRNVIYKITTDDDELEILKATLETLDIYI